MPPLATLEFHASVVKNLVIGGLILLGGLASAGLLWQDSPIHEYSVFLNGKGRLGAYVMVGLAILAVPAIVMRLLRSAKPVLTISPSGFLYRRGPDGVIAWHHVESISANSYYGSAFVTVNLTEEGWRQAPIGSLIKMGRHVGKLSGLTGVNISTAELSISNKELAARMEAYRLNASVTAPRGSVVLSGRGSAALASPQARAFGQYGQRLGGYGRRN